MVTFAVLSCEPVANSLSFGEIVTELISCNIIISELLQKRCCIQSVGMMVFFNKIDLFMTRITVRLIFYY